MAAVLPRTIPEAIEYLSNEHVLVRHDDVMPWKQYPACDWCENEPDQPAVLSWRWYVPSSTTDGCTDTCVNWPCLRAALRYALLDSEPENITVLYPVVAVREVALAA